MFFQCYSTKLIINFGISAPEFIKKTPIFLIVHYTRAIVSHNILAFSVLQNDFFRTVKQSVLLC